jgi:hypothetical protein
VISRFIDGRFLLKGDEERRRYLSLFSRALTFTDWRCLGYALMSSHVHSLLVAGASAPESWLKRTHVPLARWLNEREGRFGPVFAARPAMYVVADEEVRSVLAYIHNNPVRAGLVATASESDWTSHRFYVGQETPPAWLCVDEGRMRVGIDDSLLFDEWVEQCRVAPSPHRSMDDLVKRVADTARRRGATEVATPVVGPAAYVPLVARPHSTVRPNPRVVVEAVARVCEVEPGEICSRTARANLVDVRHLVVVVGLAFGVTASDLAAAIGISRSAAARLAHRRKQPDNHLVEAAVRLVVRHSDATNATASPVRVR